MTAITQTVADGDTSKTAVAAHQDENGIYGVATATQYGHVLLLSDSSIESVPTGATFSASAIKELVGQMGNPGEINWPNGNVPSIGTMLDTATFLITNSGAFTLPEGKYRVEVVGGGAPGQAASTPYPSAPRPGAGGASSSPVQDTVKLNTAAAVNVTVGASGGNSVFTVAGKTITGPVGTGTGSAGGSPGATGLSYTHPGGAGGSYKNVSQDVQQGDDYVTCTTSGYGGGGGSGSRLSRVITNVTAANGERATSNTGAFGNGGAGGVGYGAGGGGGGTWVHAACAGSGSKGNGAGGAGAPGCSLITAFM